MLEQHKGPDKDDLRRRLSDPTEVLLALGLLDGSEGTHGGRVIRCFWHADGGRPNLSVTRRDRDGDGTISLKCFSCQATGDVFHLIAAARGMLPDWHSGRHVSNEDFKRVLGAAAGLLGEGAPRFPPRKESLVIPGAKKKDFPAPAEVASLWESCLPLMTDETLVAQLKGRGLDPTMLRGVRALPRVGKWPRWAYVRGPVGAVNWAQAYYRLCLPMYNHEGSMVTLHTRRFGVAGDERKGTNPSGCTFVGSVLANQAGLHVLQGSRPITKIAICEGGPDFLVLSTQWPDDLGWAVFGVVSGSWTQDIADRIPSGAHVVIWTHTDNTRNKRGKAIEGSGQLYAIKVARTLAARCDVRVVYQDRPTGEEKKAPDINDILLAGGRPAVDAMLASARLWRDPVQPGDPDRDPQDDGIPAAVITDLQQRWNKADGLGDLPVVEELRGHGMDVGVVEEFDLMRVVEGTAVTRAFSRRGELIGFRSLGHDPADMGVLADPVGLHLLRTGQAPPGGVVVTSGILNFLALATHWKDDARAPAVLTGLPGKELPEGTRLIAWPASALAEMDQDVDVVTAGLPHVALRVGGFKAIEAAMAAAQPRPRPEKEPEPAERKPPPPSGWARTDFGNAERMVYHFGVDLRYVGDWESWFVWDRRRWQRDRTGAVMRHAKATARLIEKEIDVSPDEQAKHIRKWSLDSENQGRLRAMIGLAASEPGVPVVPERLDGDPYLLNVRNGTLDLRTGTLLPHRREHLITKLAKVAYDPRAQCPTWKTFLSQIMDGNERMIGFIKRALGYSLTGDVGAHVFFVLYGAGRNGKSTLLLTLQHLMGDYSRQAAPDLLIDSGKGDNSSPGRAAALASLQGARLVVASETESGGRLAEAAVKAMTSGDKISAKFMGQNWFEFDPTHHIFLATNHRPKIKGSKADLGIWEKIKPIPFNVTISREKRDRTLPARLLGELPGILNWCMEGCLEWQSAGLGEPSEVEEAVQGYQDENDVIKPFLDDCCVIGPSFKIKISILRKVYELWCDENAKEPMNSTVFGTKIKEKGFEEKNDGKHRNRLGLTVNADWMDRFTGAANERERWGGR